MITLLYACIAGIIDGICYDYLEEIEAGLAADDEAAVRSQLSPPGLISRRPRFFTEWTCVRRVAKRAAYARESMRYRHPRRDFGCSLGRRGLS